MTSYPRFPSAFVEMNERMLAGFCEIPPGLCPCPVPALELKMHLIVSGPVD